MSSFRNISGLAITSLTVLFYFSQPILASAQTMSNEDYILDLNPTRTEVPSSPTPILSHNLEATSKKTYNKLAFSTDNTNLNYGDLHPGEPVIRVLSLDGQASNGMSVLAFETGNLAAPDNETIPDTTCDEGTCNESLSALWKSPLTYGFGYRIDSDGLCSNGQNCLNSFKPDYFKQLANIELKESPQILYTASLNTVNGAKVSFKVNIPSSSKGKTFINTIHLIALPLLHD